MEKRQRIQECTCLPTLSRSPADRLHAQAPGKQKALIAAIGLLNEIEYSMQKSATRDDDEEDEEDDYLRNPNYD